MTITPHIDAASPAFPGDGTPQPPFDFRDSIRSLVRWPVGLLSFAAGARVIRSTGQVVDLRRADFLLKAISRAVPKMIGVDVRIYGREKIDINRPYVYVANHVNVFDMLVIYQSIPQHTRALEHIDHFSWPVIGPLLREIGQLPIYPNDRRKNAVSLRQARERLKHGESFTVLPEGSRTLDGSLGPFFTGAFSLAIGAGVPVVPMAIRGGRAVSRRGDWRFRPGVEEVLFAAPVSTAGLRRADAPRLAVTCRQTIIDLLHGRRAPGV